MSIAAVIGEGAAGVALEVLTEGRLVGEGKVLSQLLEVQVGGEQHVLDVAYDELVNDFLGRLSRLTLADLEEVASASPGASVAPRWKTSRPTVRKPAEERTDKRQIKSGKPCVRRRLGLRIFL